MSVAVLETTRSTRCAMDAITLLKQDHARLRELFQGFKDAQDERDQGHAFQQICKEVDLHGRCEEEIYYPALSESLSGSVEVPQQEMVQEAIEEHLVLKELLGELMSLLPHEFQFRERMKRLEELVLQHVRNEEVMFDLGYQQLTGEQLEQLGVEIQLLREDEEQLPVDLASRSNVDGVA